MAEQAKDQTPETGRQEEKATPTEEISKETIKEPLEKSAEKTAEPNTDWEQKWKASQDGAIKTAQELKEFKQKWEQITPILQILQDSPELMEQVDSVYQEQFSPKASTKVIESLVDKKVQERLAPYQQEIEVDKTARVKKAFDDFVKKYPDATKQWGNIERLLPAFKNAGYPVEEALEKSYLLSNIDEAKKQGKKELAIELFNREQASFAGGFSGGQDKDTAVGLSEAEKKVAKALGIPDEEYAKNKSKK